ncbi:MAG: ribonuclease T [Succinivibrio sp.]|nr:ribonuclease T [Succinivibrio sp.]
MSDTGFAHVYQLKERFRGFLPVVVDVETAGLNPQTDALLEVAMMTVKMDERGFFTPGELISANIRPAEGLNLNQKNLDFLKIDPFDESRGLQSEAEALNAMFKTIRKEVKAQGCKRAWLVGQNAHFDLGFIMAAAERIKAVNSCPFHPFSVCDTATLGGFVFGQTVLAKACNAAHVEFDCSKAHGAIYDTQKECELFCAAINRFTVFAGIPEPLPEVLETAPAEHGENEVKTTPQS